MAAPGDGADVMQGGLGDDHLYVHDGGVADELSGGDGQDTVDYETSAAVSVTLDDQAGDGPGGRPDNVHSDIENVVGGAGADSIAGTVGPNRLSGGPGSDQVDGGAGDDVIDGGLTAGMNEACEPDTLTGGAGDDTFVALDGGDQATGGAGDDTFRAGEQTYCTNGDSQGVDPHGGKTISGGDGRDLVNYANRRMAGVVVTLDGIANDGIVGRNDDVGTDVEDITGSADGDYLVGDAGANSLDGGEGDDLLDGADGADLLLGGAGSDAVDYSWRTASVTVDLDGAPADDGEYGEGDTVGILVEAIWGGSGDDRLTGGTGDDHIDGGAGADEIAGGAGVDLVDYSTRGAAISFDADGQSDDGETGEQDNVAADVEGAFGGTGDDVLSGTAGDDALLGGPGADRIDAGAGVDYLGGDDGDDVLASRDSAADLVDCGLGADAVTADQADDVNPDCETVDVPPVPPPGDPDTGTSPPVTGGTTTPPVQRPTRPAPTTYPPTRRPPTNADFGVVPRVLPTTLAKALRKGIRVILSCSEPCATRTLATISARDARRLGLSRSGKRFRVGRKTTRSADQAGIFGFTVRLDKRRHEKLRRAKRLVVRLDIHATSRRGLKQTVPMLVELK